MGTLFDKLMVMYLIMLIGYILKKVKFIKEADLMTLSNYAIYVAMTCAILAGMDISYSKEKAVMIFVVAAIQYGAEIIVWLLCTIFLKFCANIFSEVGKIFKFALLYCNAAMVGMPIISSILDEEAVFYASVFVIFMNISLFSIGIGIMDQEGTNRNELILKNLSRPSFLIIMIGLLLFLLRIRYPLIIGNAIKAIGNTCMPTAMIVTGAMLADNNLLDVLKDWKAYIVCAFRLLIIPLTVFAMMKFIIKMENEQLLLVIPIMFASPCASGLGPFTKLFGGDYKFAINIVSISALLSIISIPIVINIVLTCI